MEIPKPAEVRRSFAKGVKPVVRVGALPAGQRKMSRMHRTTRWTGERLDYAFIEKCKELVCWLNHPSAMIRRKGRTIRLSVMPWSRGVYVDLRHYSGKGIPMAQGILLHLDIISKLLPDLITLVHRLEMEDQREPEQKAKIEVRYDPPPTQS